MMAKRILLVENDDFYVEVIGTFVKLFLQHQIATARTPMEALDRVKADPPDLVLIDLEADGHDALEFAEKMRDDARTKQIPILALSQNEARRDDALGRGCVAFLTKPFRVRELEAVIERLLAPA
jgi:two-component system, cell cycle response regulator DivK